MFKNPTDDLLITNPVGIDQPIQQLQIALKTEISWLEKVFPRAYVGRNERSKGNLEIFPAIYVGNSEVYKAVPNDELVAYSFFEVEGRYTIEKYQSNGISGSNKYVAPISLVVWGDLKKVNALLDTPYSDQNFSQNLIVDILSVIRKQYDFRVNSIEDNTYSVFEPYTCRSDDPTMFYYPYFCVKFRMDVAFTDECNITTPSQPASTPSNTLDAGLDFGL